MHMKYNPTRSNIHVVARGLLDGGDYIVLCKVKDENWFFFPGGHIEDGESTATALLRELNEEIGNNKYEVSEFVGVCESVFQYDKETLQQGVDLIFRVKLDKNFAIDKSKKDHIEFVKINKKELSKLNILPVSLKEGIVDWIAGNQIPFFKKMAGTPKIRHRVYSGVS